MRHSSIIEYNDREVVENDSFSEDKAGIEPSLCMKPMSMDSGTPSIKIPSQIENATEESGGSPPSAAP